MYLTFLENISYNYDSKNQYPIFKYLYCLTIMSGIFGYQIILVIKLFNIDSIVISKFQVESTVKRLLYYKIYIN